jgi:S1-C subfamily serine protease
LRIRERIVGLRLPGGWPLDHAKVNEAKAMVRVRIGPTHDSARRCELGARRRLRPMALAVLLGLTSCARPEPAPEPIRLSFTPAMSAEERRVADTWGCTFVHLRVFKRDALDSDGRPAWLTTVNDGSGTLLDGAGHIVTPAHLIPSAGLTVEAQTIDGRWHPAELIDLSPERELALLRMVPPSGCAFPQLPGQPPSAGERVLAIGAPDGRPGVVLSGRVQEPRFEVRLGYGAYGYADAIVLELDAAPGFSGGPVFDRQGRLIGMLASFGLGDITRVPYRAPRRGFAIPAAAIQAYLEEVSNRR